MASNILLPILLVAFTLSVMANLTLDEQWKDFKAKHDKSYGTPEEETRRLAIFQETLNKIEEHNKKYAAGEVSYMLGINQFADLTPEEFSKTHLGFRPPNRNNAPTAI